MAEKKIRYSEPADYFPKSVRKMFETETKKKTVKKSGSKKGKK